MKLFLFILVVFTHEIAYSQSSLYGKTFEITLQVSGKTRDGIKWTKDELSFIKDKFASKFMSEREKFPPFEYSFMNDSTFTAEGRNLGGSTIVWEGKISGNKIEGVATWTNMHGPQKEIFEGSLREK